METDACDTLACADAPAQPQAPTLVIQRLPYGCGVACLAMATGASHEQAQVAFEALRLARWRNRKPPYSSNSTDVVRAAALLNTVLRRIRFSKWNQAGTAILKTRVRKGNWHWIVGWRPVDGAPLELFDPSPTPAAIDVATGRPDLHFYAPQGYCLVVTAGRPPPSPGAVRADTVSAAPDRHGEDL